MRESSQRVGALLERRRQTLLDRGALAVTEVGLKFVYTTMLLMRCGRCDFMLPASSDELLLTLLLGLLPLTGRLFVSSSALFPLRLKSLLRPRNCPSEDPQRLRFERLRVRHGQRRGKRAWLELRYRHLHRPEVHANGMVNRPHQQVL